MGCVTSIAIALWLIAFAAGVLLLYKVQKENLQWPFKIAGWIITVVALGGMLCCSLRCMMACAGGNCGRPPMGMYHHGMMWRGGHCEGEESCCKKGRCEKDEECCEEDDEDEHAEEVKIIINDSTTSKSKGKK
ncbi:MAG: hypothetical protein N2203_01630 [Bacteroidia bacterium]|nr:hypothetical protein [Bacteroidia bacterium]